MLTRFFQLILVFLSFQLHAQEYIQTIGDPIEDGQFRQAAGIAVDADGNLYVGDVDANRITKFNAAGEVVLVFGEPGSQPGQFYFDGYRPPNFLITSQNRLLITDSRNYRIQTFTLDGQFISEFSRFGSEDGQFLPGGIAEDSEGNLYVSDSWNHRVQKFNSDGVFLRKWGTKGSGDGQFGGGGWVGPTGIVVDDDDHILVADGSNGRIQVFDSTGNYLSEFGEPFQWAGAPPQLGELPTGYGYLGLAIDGNGNIYVTDYFEGRIQKFDANGNPLAIIGSPLQSDPDGGLMHPISLAVDLANNLYAVNGESFCYPCTDLNRVRKFDSSGNYLQTFGRPGNNDGQLDNPTDIAINDNGLIYVVDQDNQRVQIFNSNGVYQSSFGEFDNFTTLGSLATPGEITLDPAGNVYISEDWGYEVKKYTPNGVYLRKIGEYGLEGDGKLVGIQDIEVDEFANLYTMEASKNQIQKFDSTGLFLKSWAVHTEVDTFNISEDIAIDTVKNVLYCMAFKTGSTESYYLVKFDYEGNHLGTFDNIAEVGSISISPKSTILLTSKGSIYKDQVFEYDDTGQLLRSWGGHTEPNQNLRFKYPNSTAFDKNGFFYIADTWNHRVQKIRLEDYENAPVISAQKFTVAENSPWNTEIGTLVASDPNDLPLTWSIRSGNEPGYVNIEESTGALLLNDSSWFDYESNTELNLVAVVSNSTSSSVAAITIEITDVNEAPSQVLVEYEISENTANGTSIGLLNTTDPENDDLTYSISLGDTEGIFAIGRESGEILVIDNEALDFETFPEIELVISVSDGILSSESQALIKLTNANEAPEVDDQQFEVDEHVDNGTVVGTVLAEDPESDPMAFELVSGNQLGIFAIDESTGEISVADKRSLDFEQVQGVTLGIEVSDAEFTTEAVVSISIRNIDETITALKEDDFGDIRIYPNPAGDYITIDLPEADRPTIYFTDLSGKIVKRFVNVTGTIKHGLSKGTYILTVSTSDGNTMSQRVVLR